MAKRFVEYTGPSDVRELTAADFKRLGVEDAKKESFQSGQVYEMSSTVVEALVGSDSLVADEFKEVDADQVELVEDDEAPRSRRRESNPPAMSQSGAASGDTGAAGGTTSGRGRTGRGSTAGSAT